MAGLFLFLPLHIKRIYVLRFISRQAEFYCCIWSVIFPSESLSVWLKRTCCDYRATWSTAHPGRKNRLYLRPSHSLSLEHISKPGQLGLSYSTTIHFTAVCCCVYIYIYIHMCRGRWGTVHRCTSTIAVFSHFSNWLAVTLSAKSHDALLSDRTCFVSASFRSRSATPAAAWTNAPPPRHQLANMWSPCIRTTGWRYCSARTMCSYNR